MRRLLHVAAWLLANPASAIPARQVPVPGINSKLIEQHTKLLRALLDTADPTLADATQALFAARYGLATPDRLLRLRASGALVGLPHLRDAEVSLPLFDDVARARDETQQLPATGPTSYVTAWRA